MKVFTIKQGKASVGATESVTAESTPEDFIEEIAAAAAAFIAENREAFDADDATAVQEFTQVFLVDTVTNRMLEILQTPPVEEPEVQPIDEDPALIEAAPQNNLSEEENPEMVSSDVMALLDS